MTRACRTVRDYLLKVPYLPVGGKSSNYIRALGGTTRLRTEPVEDRQLAAIRMIRYEQI